MWPICNLLILINVLHRYLGLMIAPTKERKKEKILTPTIWCPQKEKKERISILRAPSLTKPTHAISRNLGTLSVTSHPSEGHELLDLTLACLTWLPDPFPLFHSLPSRVFISAARCPPHLPSHNVYVSFLRAVHSLRRYSLLCLHCLHHQHRPDPVHLQFSLRNTVVVAWPLNNW